MRLDVFKIKMLQAGITQGELAERAGISRVGYNSMLAKGRCSPESLVKLAAALGVEPIELVADGNSGKYTA